MDGNTDRKEKSIKMLKEKIASLERRLAEAGEKADESLRKLSRAVEQSPSCIVITDTTGRIEYVNPKFTQLTGYSLEEVIGNNPRVLKSGLTPESVYKDLWSTLLAGREWRGEFCNRKKNGELYWENASISPITNEQGVITHYLAVKENITERKLTEKALRERSQRLGLLSYAAGELLRGNDPIALVETISARLASLVDIDFYCHHLISADGQYLELAASSGLSPEELTQMERRTLGEDVCGRTALSCQPIIVEDVQNSLDEQVAQIRKRGVAAYACYPLTNQGRLIGTLSYGTRKVSHFDRETLSLFQAVSDLTAVAISRRDAELALQDYATQLERSNQELQEFAFVASHDLQEPLRKIDAFGQLLLARSDNLDAEQRDYLERMQQASRRMSRMVEDLLALSRVCTRGKPFLPVRLSDIAADLISDLEMQLDRTGGKVEVGALPVIEADPSQMRQLLQNLVSNALKYHKPGVPPLVRISSKKYSIDRVQILVEDNGIGFDEKNLDYILQPFHRLVGRSEYEGTGMGLAISKKIVERHAGEISARSKPGEGSTFILTLPVKAPPDHTER